MSSASNRATTLPSAVPSCGRSSIEEILRRQRGLGLMRGAHARRLWHLGVSGLLNVPKSLECRVRVPRHRVGKGFSGVVHRVVELGLNPRLQLLGGEVVGVGLGDGDDHGPQRLGHLGAGFGDERPTLSAVT